MNNRKRVLIFYLMATWATMGAAIVPASIELPHKTATSYLNAVNCFASVTVNREAHRRMLFFLRNNPEQTNKSLVEIQKREIFESKFIAWQAALIKRYGAIPIKKLTSDIELRYSNFLAANIYGFETAHSMMLETQRRSNICQDETKDFSAALDVHFEDSDQTFDASKADKN